MAKKLKAQQEPQSETPIVEKSSGGFVNLFGVDLSPFGLSNNYAKSDTGEIVTPYRALGVSAVYAAVKALSEDVGNIPLLLYEKVASRGKAVITNHPIIELLDEPNEWQTRQELITKLVMDLLLDGNAFCWVERNFKGDPIRLVPIDPRMMTVMIDQSNSGEIFYTFTCQMYPTEIFACGMEDMIHIRSAITGPNGVLGMSPISLGQGVIGLGIATQKSASVMFASGQQLKGFLSVKGKLSKEGREHVAEQFAQNYAGVQNAHKVAVLQEDTSFQPMGQNAEESQLLDSRKFSVEEIARWFRIPTTKIGNNESSSYANIVGLAQAYLDDSLLPHCIRIETQFLRKLFVDPKERKKYFLKFDLREKNRANQLDRVKAYQLLRFTGLVTANECREQEDLNPIPDGDTFLTPMNMTLTGKPNQQSGTTIDTQPNPNAEPDEDDET